MEARNEIKTFKVGSQVIINEIYANFQPILYEQFKGMVFKIDNIVMGMLGYTVYLISNGPINMIMERREIEVYSERVSDYDLSYQYRAYIGV